MSAADAAGFWAAYERCFGEPQPERTRHRRLLAESGNVAGYTAHAGDEVVAVALLFLHDRVALLADAAACTAS